MTNEESGQLRGLAPNVGGGGASFVCVRVNSVNVGYSEQDYVNRKLV
jgi:hypothetical protein